MSSKRVNKTARTAAPNKNITKVSARRKNTAFGGRKKWGVAAIIGIAVLGISLITVGTAALSQNLNINGTATVKGLNWSVHFANLEDVVLTGKASEKTAPTLGSNNTKIGDYEVILSRPGDAVEYGFEVVNDGEIDAEITSITIKTGSGLECTSTSDKADTICANLGYTLKYSDGSAAAVGDALDAGATRKMTLKLSLDSTLDLIDMPDTDVEVGGLDVVITYGQKVE